MNQCDVFPQSSINMKVASNALIAADQLTLLGMFDQNAALDFVDPDNPPWSDRDIIWYCAISIRLDVWSYLVGRKQYVGYNIWTNILNNSCAVQCFSWFCSRSIVFVLYNCNTYRRFSDCQEFRVFIHENADDLQIYDHYLAHELSQLTIRLTHFIEVISQWISSNRLKLSASKTKFIWLSSTRSLARGTFDPIIINDKTSIQASIYLSGS